MLHCTSQHLALAKEAPGAKEAMPKAVQCLEGLEAARMKGEVPDASRFEPSFAGFR